MSRMRMFVVALIAVVVIVSAVIAAQPKTYQVTGPVMKLTDDLIVVQKGKDLWELGRDANTKVTGTLAVGSKVTIEYRMIAATVEVKPAAKPKGK
jgi:hypothetical protein